MLSDRAVLEMSIDGTDGQFHFMHPDQIAELTREFLIGGRGQAIAGVADVIFDEADIDTGGQEEYYLDVGQGEDVITLTFEGGYDKDEYNGVPVQWGDGSDGIDRWDAAGAHPLTMAQTLKWWARNTRTDSFRASAALHWGEWTDGSIDGEVGLFEDPITVVVESVRIERDGESPSSFEGTIEVKRAASIIELAEYQQSPAYGNNPENIPDR